METIGTPQIELVRWIIQYASICDYKLTKMRLVKFLYLADLYHFRSMGSTLTCWPWKFWKLGPYCVESIKALEAVESQQDMLVEKRQSDFEENDYTLYSSRDPGQEQRPASLPTSVRGHLADAIKKYGSDTSALLEYVYFHTEPMLYGRPAQALDFSMVRRWEELAPVSPRTMSPSQIRKAREIADRIPKPSGYVAAMLIPEGDEDDTGRDVDTESLSGISIELRVEPE